MPKPSSSSYSDKRLVSHIIQRNLAYKFSLDKDNYIDPGINATLVAILSSILRAGQDKRNFDILDIGGGGGHLGVTLSHLFPQFKFECVLIETDAMIRALRERTYSIPYTEIYTLSQFWLSNKKCFDIVVANSSIQYIENAADELRRVLAQVDAKFVFVGKTPFHEGTKTITGKQISNLLSNGPKAMTNSKNILVEYSTNIMPLKDFLEIFKTNFFLVYQFQEGITTLTRQFALYKIRKHFKCSTFLFQHSSVV